MLFTLLTNNNNNNSNGDNNNNSSNRICENFFTCTAMLIVP